MGRDGGSFFSVRGVRTAVVASAAVLGLLASCSGGASAPEPFAVSEATVADATTVRSAFEDYASQWREILATEGFRYDTAAGVAQNMTTSEAALSRAVPALTATLTAEVVAYRSRAGSSVDAAAVADVEGAVAAMSSVVAELSGAREAVLSCFLAATVDDECVAQQDRLSALIDYFEESYDEIPLVPGAPDPDDSVA